MASVIHPKDDRHPTSAAYKRQHEKTAAELKAAQKTDAAKANEPKKEEKK